MTFAGFRFGGFAFGLAFLLGTTVVTPSNTGPAIRLVSQTLQGRASFPREQLLTPSSYPDLAALGSRETEVLRLYVEGKSYQEIGDHLDRHVKSIDNALQRIKRKLEVHLTERADADHDEDLALIA